MAVVRLILMVNDDFLTDEQWTQLSGPSVTIEDATEEIAFFTPSIEGAYRFELEVSDGIDTDTDTVLINVIQAPRISNGLQVLYTFEENSGTTINDVSAVGTELDLMISNQSAINWLPDGGIKIIDKVTISSDTSATKIINACTNSHEISIETWIVPDSTTQSGPARIVSLSADTLNRNFTLGQEDDRYDARLRTTSTNTNGTPSITVPASTVETELSHVVYTRDNNGSVSIYKDGIPQVVGNIGGNLTNWNDNYRFILANEATGDRQWLGEIYLAAVYCVALDSSQVAQNFSAGLPPYASVTDSDNDDVIDALDNCPNDANMDQANLDGDSAGDVCDNDIDNDGIANNLDSAEFNNKLCRDSDADMCDDCSIGVDGFGPLLDADPNNDGLDTDGQGDCNLGDLDDDNDSILDTLDNCPLQQNPLQQDRNANGIGDACDTDNQACFVIKTQTNEVVTCLFVIN